MNTLKVQARIRHNAEELSSYLSDMNQWEKDIRSKDSGISQGKIKNKKSVPRRNGAGTIHIGTKSIDSDGNKTTVEALVEKSSSAANHTYDVGYKKWEKFNPDEVSELDPDMIKSQQDSSRILTPATIVQKYIPSQPVVTAVPRALGQSSGLDAEAVERERGNDEFKKGNFPLAIKSYTKCLGMKTRNYIAFSNRAMAYLRLKEHVLAETDCSCALSIHPGHVKSLVRRAAARTALGKHRAALTDLLVACSLDENKYWTVF
eukprot:gene10232-21337_t